MTAEQYAKETYKDIETCNSIAGALSLRPVPRDPEVDHIFDQKQEMLEGFKADMKRRTEKFYDRKEA